MASVAAFSTLVSRTRCNARALLRRAGTQKRRGFADAWAPALQRTAEEALRCVRGTRPRCGAPLSHHRHCERSEAIQNSSAEAVWIASSQELLAMTEQADTLSLSRGSSRPSFAHHLTPQLKEGAGKTGCWLAPAVHCAKVALQEAAQRHTGEAETSGLPCAVV